MAPTLDPSTYTKPRSYWPAVRATPPTRSTTVPFSAMITRSAGTPVSVAMRAFATWCRTSPWTGIALPGFRMLYAYISSPAAACPETCTAALPLCTTVAPSFVSPLMTR